MDSMTICFCFQLSSALRKPAMSQCSGLSQCDVQVIITESTTEDVDKLEYQRPAYVAVVLIMAMTIISVFFPMVLTALGMTESIYERPPPPPCLDNCRLVINQNNDTHVYNCTLNWQLIC